MKITKLIISYKFIVASKLNIVTTCFGKSEY